MGRRVEHASDQARRLRREPLTARESRRVAEARPRNRTECRGHSGPCPFVSCRHHLGLTVNPAGSIEYPVAEIEPWEVSPSCSLDVADEGQHSLTKIARYLGITKQRAQQIERHAMLRLMAIGADLDPGPLCAVCGRRSVGWISGCKLHTQAFERSKVVGLVLARKVSLAAAWDRWVDSVSLSGRDSP